MRGKKTHAFTVIDNPNAEPFSCVEEVWFWFIQANEAKNEGARITAGAGLFARPCEPLDILKILDGLYRNRVLKRDHFLVLRHYGRRMLAPDPRRIKEVRAAKLWAEAIAALEPVMVRKGLVQKQLGLPYMEVVE